MVPYFCLLLCWLSLPLPGLQIFDPEEVEYVHSNVTATVGSSATLDCGSTMPVIFIWGFIKTGHDNNVLLACNYGHGTELQPASGGLGSVHVPENTSALVIEEIRQDAAGMYTCQAMYDTDSGASVAFYSNKLIIDGGGQ